MRNGFFLDTYSGIGNRKGHYDLVVTHGITLNVELHKTFLGIFYRVGQNVYKYLFDTDFISEKFRRGRRIYIYLKPKSLGFSSRPYHVYYLRQHVSYLITDRYYIHVAGFELAHIEDVIDDRKQHLAGSLNTSRVISHLF